MSKDGSITSLEISCDFNGTSRVRTWLTIHSDEDVGDLIEWLIEAKKLMTRWQEIRGVNAKITKLSDAIPKR